MVNTMSCAFYEEPINSEASFETQVSKSFPHLPDRFCLHLGKSVSLIYLISQQEGGEHIDAPQNGPSDSPGNLMLGLISEGHSQGCIKGQTQGKDMSAYESL